MPIILDTSTSTITVDGTVSTPGKLLLQEVAGTGSSYVGLQAPTNVASNVTFTLPSADGTVGQAIVTDGSGTLSFGNTATVGKSIGLTLVFGL